MSERWKCDHLLINTKYMCYGTRKLALYTSHIQSIHVYGIYLHTVYTYDIYICINKYIRHKIDAITCGFCYD